MEELKRWVDWVDDEQSQEVSSNRKMEANENNMETITRFRNNDKNQITKFSFITRKMNIENKISLKVLERSKTDFFNSFEKERNNDFSQQKIKKSISFDSSSFSKAKTIDYNNIVP